LLTLAVDPRPTASRTPLEADLIMLRKLTFAFFVMGFAFAAGGKAMA
jgi:hypothetical protein